jgi:hypothetical protein
MALEPGCQSHREHDEAEQMDVARLGEMIIVKHSGSIAGWTKKGRRMLINVF